MIGLLAFSAAACRPADDLRPNIVLIIADDQAWQDFGFMGSDVIHTPSLDALAREGVLFTHGFNTASECRSSLRTLLTGLQPLQLETVEAELRSRGVRFPQMAAFFSLDALPKRLAEAGYVSFQGGKYWEGAYATSGFTEGMSTGQGAGGTVPATINRRMWGGEGLKLGRTTMKPLFDFIDAHADEPFFVWFAPMLPHLPHNPGVVHKRHYPQDRFSSEQRGYYGNITRLDARVGGLLAHLAKRGLRERTLVIFLSDNGWQMEADGEGSLPSLGAARGKLSIYENGFRTPIVFSWPGHIEGGREESKLVSTVDLFPTILDFAGASTSGLPGSGESLGPLLMGAGEWTRDRVMGALTRIRLEEDPGGGMEDQVRAEIAYFHRGPRWRYVWYADRDREALYDIEVDPWERDDVIDQHRELARRLRSELLEWSDEMRSTNRPAATP
jgi:arylsulfatase A-like enzyme